MESKHLHQSETLYRAALEREPAERPAFLSEACGSDEELRREVESLLAYDERAAQFLEVPALEVEARSIAADSNSSLIGRQLSHYRITEKIGSGGMGEVYRARDIRLERDVAVKVSSDHFTERFEREARLVAALNHPNICTLHDVGPNYLVMELVEGPTLAERIQQGSIPWPEALSIAKQIAAALDVAHEKGIVHRDLKPGNIKIKPDGTVKVLDFGLAKMDTRPVGSGGGGKPTATTRRTELGIIEGTPGYMAPEQADGRHVDRRADIWAFGVVLYEMLTGLHPFRGETVSDIMAAVSHQELDWTPVPTPLRRLIQRCLERNPKRRLRDIGDALWEIEHIDERREESVVPVEKGSTLRRSVWLAAAAVALALAAGAIVWLIKPSEPPPLRRFELPAVPGIHAITMSPDGSLVAYIANGHLYVRAFNALQPRDLGPVPKPQQSVGPVDAVVFWSPDSKTIGFATDGTIRTLPAGGGPSFAICKVPASGAILGAAWRADGTIVFSVWRDSLYKVPASGGTAELYLAVDPATEVDFHRISPLSDNRIIVMTHLRGAQASYRAEIFDGKKRIVLVKNDAGLGSFAPTHGLGLIYASPGYLLFSRYDANTGVWAVPFSTDPIDSSKAVLVEAGSDVVDAADDGTLLTESISTQTTRFQLAWLDRRGLISEIPAPLEFEDSSGPVATTQGMAFALSPDSHLVAFASASPRDIFIRDLSTAVDTRLTFDGISKGNPSWFPSGGRVLYSVRPLPESSKMIWRDVDGTGDAHELGDGSNGRISPDGRYLVYLLDDRGRARLRYAEALADGTFGPWQNVFSAVDEPNVASFDLSSDGRLIAYTSVGVGTEPEIYLTQFPGGKGRWQVTSGESASLPRFSRDGRELFYVSGSAPGRLMAVAIALQPAVKLGPASVLFDMTKKEANGLSAARGYDVSRDGKRFLLSRSLPPGASEDARLVVLQNWRAAIKK